MKLNDFGCIVKHTWNDLSNHNKNIALDVCVIMPNHIHCIVQVVGAGSKPALDTRPRSHVHFTNDSIESSPTNTRADLESAPTKNHPLSEIVRQLKTFSTRLINKKQNRTGISIWQRNYYEHIIRNEDDLNQIRQYIMDNPSNWENDDNHPGNSK